MTGSGPSAGGLQSRGDTPVLYLEESFLFLAIALLVLLRLDKQAQQQVSVTGN